MTGLFCLIFILVSSWLAFRTWKLIQSQNTRSTQKAKTQLEEFVKRFGGESNHFLTLYPHFEYWEEEGTGAIPYVDTGSSWIAACSPLADKSQQLELLSRFSHQARLEGKAVFMLPVSSEFKKKAAGLGFQSISIGTEPTFVLDSYEPCSLRCPNTKHLFNQGFKVEEKPWSELTPDLIIQSNHVLKEWLGKLRMPPLGFLNQVLPWELGAQKRYFFFKTPDNQVLAFLVAVPIPALQGWYLVDCLRSSSCPVGTSEMLVIETLRMLKESGAKMATLGVAPLAEVSTERTQEHPWIQRFLSFTFHHLNFCYRFKSLFEFKMKFKPVHCEPVYLIYSPGSLNLRGFFSILRAFIPCGLLHLLGSVTLRTLKRISLLKGFEWAVNRSLVFNPFPQSLACLVFQIPMTLTLLGLTFFGLSLADCLQFLGHEVPVVKHKPSFVLICFCFLVISSIVESLRGKLPLLLFLALGLLIAATLHPLEIGSSAYFIKIWKHIITLMMFACLGHLFVYLRLRWILISLVSAGLLLSHFIQSTQHALAALLALLVGSLIAQLSLEGLLLK